MESISSVMRIIAVKKAIWRAEKKPAMLQAPSFT
jgi:hypothetical protein